MLGKISFNSEIINAEATNTETSDSIQPSTTLNTGNLAPEQVATDSPQGIIGTKDTIEPGGALNFLDALNFQSSPNLEQVPGTIHDIAGQAANSAAWDKYEALLEQIQLVLDSLPSDVSQGLVAKLNDLRTQIQQMIYGPPHPVVPMSEGQSLAELEAQFEVKDAPPLPKMPPEVLQLLQDFLTEIQGLNPPSGP